MDNSVIYLVTIGVLLVAFVLVSMKTNKSKKLKITTADPDVNGELKTIDVIRKWSDSWEDYKDMKCYHTLDKKKIWLATHWILKIEEV